MTTEEARSGASDVRHRTRGGHEQRGTLLTALEPDGDEAVDATFPLHWLIDT